MILTTKLSACHFNIIFHCQNKYLLIGVELWSYGVMEFWSGDSAL